MLININPKLWGDSFWGTMYYIVLSYPDNPTEQDKNYVRSLFLDIKNVLPCENCRQHFQQNLVTYPLDDNVLANQTSLLTWLVNVNNEVNSRTNKKPVTVQEMIDKYMNKNIETNMVQILTVCLLILLIIIFIYFMRH